jgi:DNA-binding transcriptional MocR family regulator
VAQARIEYARRRQVLVQALAAAGVGVGGTDGINIWVPVQDETAAVVRLASMGVGVTPGAPFEILPALPGQLSHVRVTCGLLADGHGDVAAALAAAARGSVRVPV